MRCFYIGRVDPELTDQWPWNRREDAVSECHGSSQGVAAPTASGGEYLASHDANPARTERGIAVIGVNASSAGAR